MPFGSNQEFANFFVVWLQILFVFFDFRGELVLESGKAGRGRHLYYLRGVVRPYGDRNFKQDTGFQYYFLL